MYMSAALYFCPSATGAPVDHSTVQLGLLPLTLMWSVLCSAIYAEVTCVGMVRHYCLCLFHNLMFVLTITEAASPSSTKQASVSFDINTELQY